MSLKRGQAIGHLALITANYPSPAARTNGTFVRQFARELTRQGISCTVIAPVPVHKCAIGSGYPKHSDESLADCAPLVVYRPCFVSASAWQSLSFLGRFSPTRLTYLQYMAASRRVLRSLDDLPDAFYGHFLYFGGATAVKLGMEFNRPSFPCVGEGVLWTVDRFGDRVAQSDLKHATGMIANNSDLGKTVSHRLAYPLENICCIPNGADTSRFRPFDKQAARALFDLPADDFIVGSVGNFKHEKGVHRVAQAINGEYGMSGAFAGAGPIKPEADNIVFCGRVPHDDMPQFLSACDLFVLPTLVEGSSNATVEAMACGLPVIGSNLPFNEDLLDDEMAIQVDPLDVDAIRGAVKQLQSDGALRQKMGERARAKAESLDISVRVKTIIDFMTSHIAETE